MKKYLEVKAGEEALLVNSGTSFTIGEDEITEVTRIEGDTVYALNGEISFKIHQVRIITPNEGI